MNFLLFNVNLKCKTRFILWIILDCGCYDCGLFGCLVGNLTGFPPGIGYFVDLYKNKITNYITKLLKK